MQIESLDGVDSIEFGERWITDSQYMQLLGNVYIKGKRVFTRRETGWRGEEKKALCQLAATTACL